MMITYEANRSIEKDEEEFNMVHFGRSVRYRTFDLDYRTNIKPYLILENIKKVVLDTDKLSFYRSDVGIKALVSLINECIDCSNNNSIEQIIDFLPDYKSIEDSIKALKIYSQKDGLTGWFACLKINKIKNSPENENYETLLKPISNDTIPFNGLSNVEEKKRENTLNLLTFLNVLDTEVLFNSIIPESMYEQIKDFIKFSLNILACNYNVELPNQLLEDIKYKKANQPNNENDAFKITSIEGIRIINKAIVIDGFEFKSSKDTKFLKDILSFNDSSIIREVCFQNCCFNTDNNSLLMVCGNIQFQNCRFDKIFKGGLILEGNMEFNGCRFFSNLDLKYLQLNKISGIYIEYCFFEKGSYCDLSNIQSVHNNTRFIHIKNTIFNGELRLSDINDYFLLKMNNVSFGCPFKISNIKLVKYSEFENLIFSSFPSTQMDKSRKDLYEVMKSAGLEEQAKAQGIYAVEETKETNDFDYDAYKVAYETGYLKSEYAAYLLEKSVSYLGQKRKKDKERTTRDSIPFIGEGKNIKYPVDALLAYKAKDGDKLKELRQKYKEIED